MRIFGALVAAMWLASSAAASVRLPAPDGVEVVASRSDHEGVCLSVKDPESGSVGTCGVLIGDPFTHRLSKPNLPERGFALAGRTIAGAVPATATSVEVHDARLPRVVAASTFAVADPSLADVRFYVVRLPAGLREVRQPNDPNDSPGPYSIRALDAHGKLVALADDATQRPPVLGPVRVLTGKLGRGGFSLDANRTSVLASVPGVPERREDRICLRVRAGGRVGAQPSVAIGGAPGDPLTLGNCLDPARLRTAELRLTACAGRGYRLFVLPLRPGQADARLVLGSGRRIRGHLAPLPGRLGAKLKVTALVAPADVSVRELERLDAAGQVTSTEALGEAAVQPEDCGASDDAMPPTIQAAAPGRTIDPPAAAPAARGGSHTLLAGDSSDGQLCLAIDAAPATTDGCDTPYADARANDLLVTPAAVAGSVPAAVTDVEVWLSDGQVLHPPLGTGDYAGAWKDVRRFFLAEIPAGVEALMVVRREPEGYRTIVADLRTGGSQPLSSVARPRGRSAAGARIWTSTLLRISQQTSALPAPKPAPVVCVGPRRPRRSDRCSILRAPEADAATVDVLSSCSDPGPSVVAVLKEKQRLVLRLAGGRTVPGRTLRVGNRRVAIATGSSDRAIKQIEILQTGRTPLVTRRLRLPAGRDDCGYRLRAYADPVGQI